MRRFPTQSTAPSGSPPTSIRPRTAPGAASSTNATPPYPRSASATNKAPVPESPVSVGVQPSGAADRWPAGPTPAAGAGATGLPAVAGVGAGRDAELPGETPSGMQAARTPV